MSKELKNIDQNIMNQIHEGKIKMRPKIYFVIGSILTFVGLVASITTSIFAIGLIKFFLRSNGVLGHKLDRIFAIFPWWIFILAILGLVIGILLIKKYDFSYKIDFKKAIVLTILAIVISGWLVDALGFNDLLIRKGLMRGVMRQYIQDRSDWNKN